MKIKKIFILPLLILLMVFSFTFKTKAGNNYTETYYNLNFSDNALIYTFPDYHSSYNSAFITIYQPRLDINTIAVMRQDNLLFDAQTLSEPLVNIDCYMMIWAWYFEIIEPEPDSFRLAIKIYTLPARWYRTHQFEHLMDIWIPIIDINNIVINVDNDSTLETFVDIGFEENKIKQYLEYNGFQSDYSAIGIMLDRFYDAGFDAGYERGFNDMDGGIIRAFVSPIFSFFDSFFSIPLAPGITIGSIVLIPLLLGVIGLVLYFWRKD